MQANNTLDVCIVSTKRKSLVCLYNALRFKKQVSQRYKKRDVLKVASIHSSVTAIMSTARGHKPRTQFLLTAAGRVVRVDHDASASKRLMIPTEHELKAILYDQVSACGHRAGRWAGSTCCGETVTTHSFGLTLAGGAGTAK